MKKIIIASIISTLLLAYTAWGLVTYNCNELTGGAQRALDYLSVDDLNNNDRAIAINPVSGASNYVLHFRYVSTGTTPENVANHPYYVRPDDYATSGVWHEVEPDLRGVVTELSYGSETSGYVFAEHFAGADSCARINAALASMTAGTLKPIWVSEEMLSGTTCTTGVTLDQPTELHFAASSGSSKHFYTGTGAWLTVTADHAIVTGGFRLDLGENANPNVNGIRLWDASKVVVDLNAWIEYSPGPAILLYSDTSGVYHSVWDGRFQLDDWQYDSGISVTESGGGGHANSNTFNAEVYFRNPADGTACLHIEEGHSNLWNHIYCADPDNHSGVTCIYDESGAVRNSVNAVTVDANMDTGLVVVGSYLHVGSMTNNASNAYDELQSGAIPFVNQTQTRPYLLIPRMMNPQSVFSAYQTGGTAKIYGLTADHPDWNAGTLVIQGRTSGTVQGIVIPDGVALKAGVSDWGCRFTDEGEFVAQKHILSKVTNWFGSAVSGAGIYANSGGSLFLCDGKHARPTGVTCFDLGDFISLLP